MIVIIRRLYKNRLLSPDFFEERTALNIRFPPVAAGNELPMSFPWLVEDIEVLEPAVTVQKTETGTMVRTGYVLSWRTPVSPL